MVSGKHPILQLMGTSRLAWLLLAGPSLGSLLLAVAAERLIAERAVERFRFQAMQIADAIRQRMATYEMVLRSGVALFQATQPVTRQRWHDFVAALALDRSFPGIQGLGYSTVIAPAALAQHLAAVQAEGFPDYSVRPVGERENYTAVVYLEPFSGRNLRAFGYDMFSEPTRREAMVRARDSGEAALSGMVTLVPGAAVARDPPDSDPAQASPAGPPPPVREEEAVALLRGIAGLAPERGLLLVPLPAAYLRVLGKFALDRRPALAELRAAAADQPTLHRLAHNLHGTCNTLGLTRLAALAADLDTALAAGAGQDAIERLLVAIDEAYAEVARALEGRLTGKRSAE